MQWILFNFLSTLILKLEKDTLKCFGAHLWKLATDFPILNTVYTIVTLTYISGCEEDDCVRGGATYCVQNAFFTLTLSVALTQLSLHLHKERTCVWRCLCLSSLSFYYAQPAMRSLWTTRPHCPCMPRCSLAASHALSRALEPPPLTKMNFQQEKLSFEGN